MATIILVAMLSSCKNDDVNAPQLYAVKQADLACQSVSLVHARIVGKDTSSMDIYTLEYDSKKRPVKQFHSYKGYGATPYSTTFTYEYNNLDQLVKKYIDFSTSNDQDNTSIYEYDAQGRWIKGTYTSSRSSSTLFLYYDDNGNRAKTESFDNKTKALEYTGNFQYKNGNLIWSKRLFASGYSTESTYEYYDDLENKNQPIAASMGGYYGEETVSKNLYKTIVTTSENGTSTAEYTYEINDKGFPTKTIAYYPSSGFSYISTREFQCK